MLRVAIRQCPECGLQNERINIDDFEAEHWRCEKCQTKISIDMQKIYGFTRQQKCVQGRVFASSADEAAIKIRDKHQEYEGALTVFYAWRELDWWEYMLEVTD